MSATVLIITVLIEAGLALCARTRPQAPQRRRPAYR